MRSKSLQFITIDVLPLSAMVSSQYPAANSPSAGVPPPLARCTFEDRTTEIIFDILPDLHQRWAATQPRSKYFPIIVIFLHHAFE